MLEIKDKITLIMQELFGYSQLKCQKFNLDAYSLVELLLELEQNFDILFVSGEWEDITTLDELTNLVATKTKQP